MNTKIKINNRKALNRKAKKELMNNLIDVKMGDITAFGFTGYINGNEYERITLTRESGKWTFIDCEWNGFYKQWINFESNVIAISGTINFFNVDLDKY